MCLTGDFANLDDGCCYNVAVLGIPQCSSACGTGGNCCGLEQAAHSHDKARVRTQVERIDSVTKAATNFRSSPDAGQPPAGLPRLRRATSAFTRVFDALWRRGAQSGVHGPRWLCYGSRLCGAAKGAAPRPGHERNLLLPPSTDLPVGRFVDRAVQPHLQKYFASMVGRNISMSLAILPYKRGVS